MIALEYIASVAAILFIGIISSILSKKFRISNALIMIFSGIILSFIKFSGKPMIMLHPSFIIGVSVVAIALVVFDCSSRFRIREFDSLSARAMRLFFTALILNAIALTALAVWLFKTDLLSALIFSVLMTGTSAEITGHILKTHNHSVLDILRAESTAGMPFIFIIPFLLLEMKLGLGGGIAMLDYAPTIIQQVMIGAGTGLLFGIIIFKFMKNRYSRKFSPLALITSALLTYIFSENLGGSGVISVAVLGFFFGNVYVKNKESLMEFSFTVSSSIEILVFTLVGIMVGFPLNQSFLLKSLIVFMGYLIIRYATIMIILKKRFSHKEKIFISLVSPKGIALASILLVFSEYSATGLSEILSLALACMLYSIIISLITARMKSRILGASK
ncbi:MAG: hypothetical protein NTV63_01790 [Candidatus Woesearchaeota archaeon]|nr:hypothetical protein [Candidatus Woesearchaeota archaeon]